MNKKFSTLVASILLASAVGASAADVTPNFVKAAQPETAGDYKEGVYYQLSSTDGQEVLVMEQVNGKYYLQLKPYAEAVLANSLWLIEPTVSSDVEGGLSYRFKNKRYGLYVSYNPNDAYSTTGAVSYLPGEAAIWKWSESTTGAKFANGNIVKAAFGAEKDSVIFLAKNNDGTIAALKEAAKKNYTGNAVTLTPKTAGYVRLGVDDLNSMLGMQDFTTGKLKLSFNPETTGENLFTKNEYRVVPAAGENSYSQFHLANAKAIEAAWKKELEELEAAFKKLGAMEAYNQAKSRVESALGVLLSNKERRELEVALYKLTKSLEESDSQIDAAIENLTGEDQAVKDAITNFKELLDKLDAAENAKNDNLSSLAFFEAGKNLLLDNKVNSAKDLLSQMSSDFAQSYNQLFADVAAYESAKIEADSKFSEVKDAFNSAANNKVNIDLTDL